MARCAARIASSRRPSPASDMPSGHVASEARIVSPVDDPHAAGGDRLDDAKMTNRSTNQLQRIGDRRRTKAEVAMEDVRNSDRQWRQPLLCSLVAGEQRLDRIAHRRIGAADLAQLLQSRGSVELGELVKQLTGRMPSLSVRLAHGAPGASCDANHARAARRSRFTVLTETPMASAMSSSERPPK